MHVFEKLYDISRSTPQMAYYLRNCTHTLIANPGYTMADIPLLLTDDQCRKKLVANVADPQVKLFWAQYERLKPSDQDDKSMPIINKLAEFLQPLPKNIIGQSTSTIDMRSVMDERKILLVKLDRKMEQVTTLVGSMIVALILNASAGRSSQKQFHLYADEFQRFATEDFATLLEEARKSGIGITMSHQNRAQLELSDKQADKNLKDRTLNVGNLIVFRVPTDAHALAGQFDITPQAAWEEEIEKEWVEVLEEEWEEEVEKEWHERVEEVIDDGEETIKTPLGDVIEQIVDGRRHPDQVVNNFCMKFINMVRDAQLTPREADKDTIQTRFTPRGGSYKYVQPGKYSGNELIVERARIYLKQWDEYFYKIMLEKNPYLTCGNEFFKLARDYLLLPFADEKRPNYQILVFPPNKNYRCVAWYYYGWSMLWGIPDNELNKWFKMYDEATRKLLKEEHNLSAQEVDETIIFMQPSFEALVREVRAVNKALAEQPMFGSSGIYKPRKRTQIHYLTHPRKTIMHPRQTISHPRKTITHPQRTYQDMQNEIANQLVGLPPYTAWVRLATKGKPIEHTLQTLDPKKLTTKVFYGVALQDRIARIQSQNRKDGYTRSRQEVEDEITKRQTQCSHQTQPPPLQPQPPHRKQILTCQKCGATNPQGAKFCNQCGAAI